jgi:hypothetical protein
VRRLEIINLSLKPRSPDVGGTSGLRTELRKPKRLCRGLLCVALGDLLRELLLEALDASSSIDKLLLTGKERVAVRANFDSEDIAAGRRTCFKLGVTTGTVDRDGVIIWMDSLLHFFFLYRR